MLVVIPYPAVWALGYQDHTWHLHTAANLSAWFFVVAAAVVDGAGRATTPPVPRWLTVSALAVAISSAGVAMLWDITGRPRDADVIGGPGVVTVPLAVTLAAWLAGWIISRAASRIAPATAESPNGDS